VTSPRVEAELKYLAADEGPLLELEAAASLGPATLGDPSTVAELDRYLDTADLRLAAVRWACRLRTREGRTIVSLKGPAEHRPGDLLHLRPEVEGPAGPGLGASAWPPSPARDQLLAISGDEALVERFHLEQERTERSVSIAGVRVGELSLDRVQVIHQGREIGRMAVVELELDPTALAERLDLAPLTEALARQQGLTPDPIGKFERAVALLRGG
jgi:inorganic triphosphatase YgiF